MGNPVFTESIEKFTSQIHYGGKESSFVIEDTISEKFEKLGVEAELKMSFLAGLVKVETTGKYLTEIKKDT